ncbi:30S ribosomal protein S4 [Paenibacillus sp. TRM 82003]|uniref:30S ribosomal protein S4 n=1 Tax=Kineococcus sp. TRM81007 TaxID=2925831 RepID=UPI001F56D088|nr:30S ribosomal protein S4 [Kineococcus sp. TRM81007]MCI2239127.1 30S ribosomal protein S4 [Kineococcus sp. TRM81007]MCI3924807.1 30S ribosomal protein S4 [Paenibacillus sp. TRM 82003]
MNNARPKVRISRALGVALTPKAARYMDRRPYPPGMHGRKQKKASDYATQLREKQRLRYQYDISETQLRRAYDLAKRKPGKTGQNLVQLLETRLDAVVWRAGFARTIYQARQMVVHRHIDVDGRRVDRPSYRLQPGQVISVSARSKAKTPFIVAAEGGWSDNEIPGWLDVARQDLTARVQALPVREQIPVTCDEQLVVEYYSR